MKEVQPEVPETHNGSSSQATKNKLRNKRGIHPNSRANLHPFKPGLLWKGNRSGRPKSLDELRARAQVIANQGHSDKILQDWATSDEVRKQELFMWYAFGKPPEKLETTGLENKTTLILHYDHERPDRTNGQRVSSRVS